MTTIAAANTTRTRRPFRTTFWWYLIRRVVQALIVILIVTVIVFALLHLAMPEGPGAGILGMQATQEQIEAFKLSLIHI